LSRKKTKADNFYRNKSVDIDFEIAYDEVKSGDSWPEASKTSAISVLNRDKVPTDDIGWKVTE